MQNTSYAAKRRTSLASLTLGLLLFSSAQAQRIEANYDSTLFKLDVVQSDTPILVLPDGEDESKYGRNTYWAREVGEALKLKGFSSVQSISWGETEPPIVPKIVVFVDAESSMSHGEYDSPDYATVPSGIASSNCTGSGSSFRCTHTPTYSLAQVGTSTKAYSFKHHLLSLSWFEVSLPEGSYTLEVGDRVSLIMGITSKNDCASSTLFRFLVRETISRLDLNQPDDYDYKARLARGESCRRK
jgi:hypothetical protein